MAVSCGVGLMQLINRAFIGRPYITEGDSYQEVRDTLERVPPTWAIQTRYTPAEDTKGAFIWASCKAINAGIPVAYPYEHSRKGAHYVAAVQLAKRDLKWENLALLGSVEQNGGFLFIFGEDGLNT